MSYRKLLTDTCSLYKKQPITTVGDYGVQTEETYTFPEVPTKSNVPCRFVLRDSTVSNTAPGLEVFKTYRVHFLITENIELGDMVEFKGKKYDVKEPYTPNNHHIEVEVHLQ